jgi:hypothetical protein
MARPTTKAELLLQSRTQFAALCTLIDGYSAGERQRAFKPGTMNRNIRDVLGHLYHWQLLMLDWYTVGMGGSKPAMPAEGYTWATTQELNQWIHGHYKNTSQEELRDRFERTHAEMMSLIERHSDVELFTKQRYAWTGSTSLGAYFVSATSSHYAWALKLIRKGMN